MSTKKLPFLLLFIMIQGVFLSAETFYSYYNRNNQLVFSNRKPHTKDVESITEHEIVRNQPHMMQFDENRYNRFDELILKHSKDTGVDFNLIKSIILVESNFNPTAVSPKGARGLMQLIPETAKRYGVNDLFDPDDNIRGGSQYLRYLIDLFDGELKLVLSSYNAGENLVKRIQRIPKYKETQNYVKKVVRIYGRIHTKISEDFAVYTPGSKFYKYIDDAGVITLSNIDPPKGAKPIK